MIQGGAQRQDVRSPGARARRCSLLPVSGLLGGTLAFCTMCSHHGQVWGHKPKARVAVDGKLDCKSLCLLTQGLKAGYHFVPFKGKVRREQSPRYLNLLYLGGRELEMMRTPWLALRGAEHPGYEVQAKGISEMLSSSGQRLSVVTSTSPSFLQHQAFSQHGPVSVCALIMLFFNHF